MAVNSPGIPGREIPQSLALAFFIRNNLSFRSILQQRLLTAQYLCDIALSAFYIVIFRISQIIRNGIARRLCRFLHYVSKCHLFCFIIINFLFQLFKLIGCKLASAHTECNSKCNAESCNDQDKCCLHDCCGNA